MKIHFCRVALIVYLCIFFTAVTELPSLILISKVGILLFSK